jgi:FkbM family methyltransferase
MVERGKSPSSRSAGLTSHCYLSSDPIPTRTRPSPRRNAERSSERHSGAETIKLHVAAEPSVSSVFPPNERLLRQFDAIYGYPLRQTVRVLDVPGVSLDGALESRPELPPPDLIKLDIHGAEYEALEGATRSLQRTLAVVVETWTLPIHTGQRLHADVECLLNRSGFRLFHTERVAEMSRKNLHGVLSRCQVVGYDNLYFREISNDMSIVQLVKVIALSELYGHAAFALQLVDHFSETATLSRREADALRAVIIRDNRMPNRCERLIGRFLRKLMPQLHRKNRTAVFSLTR